MPPANNNIVQVIISSITAPKTPLLCRQDQERLKLIKSERQRSAFIASHTLLNKSILEELKIDITELEYQYNNSGKPYLAPRLSAAQKLFFSLSHSGSTFAIALSYKQEVGIDIEDNGSRTPTACRKLSTRYYATEEQEYLAAAKTEAEYRYRFYQIWTLKEAYLKCIGTGINTTLSNIIFYQNDNRFSFKLEGAQVSTNYTCETRSTDAYTLALCRNGKPPLELIYQFEPPLTE